MCTNTRVYLSVLCAQRNWKSLILISLNSGAVQGENGCVMNFPSNGKINSNRLWKCERIYVNFRMGWNVTFCDGSGWRSRCITKYNTVCLQMNGAVSKVNKTFISHLTRAQRTPSAAATVQVSHALPAVRCSCLLRGRGAAGSVSKMESQQEKAFCVLRFEVSRSVITVQREFRAL